MNTVFDKLSINREEVHWEDYLETLTPVERRGRTWFKREDYFAPLGYGGVNGAKLRQLIHLINRLRIAKPETRGIISGAVTGSPQHPMMAVVARHFGLQCVQVTGAKSIVGHKNLEIAARYGAMFEFSNVGYAKTLESKSYQLAGRSPYQDYEPLETNITVTEKRSKPEEIRTFHAPAALQVTNIPEGIERIVIPCGSAISTTSILTGLAWNPHPTVKEIVLMGIGNVGSTDLSFLYRRLTAIGREVTPHYSLPNQPDRTSFYTIRHIDLNGSGYCKYSDMMPYHYEGIDFHPRYEGKCMNWIQEYAPDLLDDRTVFWVIGSEPQL